MNQFVTVSWPIVVAFAILEVGVVIVTDFVRLDAVVAFHVSSGLTRVEKRGRCMERSVQSKTSALDRCLPSLVISSQAVYEDRRCSEEKGAHSPV